MNNNDATEQAYKNGYADGKATAMAELVRCKDCVHMKQQFNARFCEVWCLFNGDGDEGFCNYGERKNENSQNSVSK